MKRSPVLRNLAQKISAPLRGAIDSTKRRLSRPTKWMTSTAYADGFDGTWHEVYPAAQNTRIPPVFFGGGSPKLTAVLDPEFPAMGVLELKAATLVGQAGWVYSREGFLLPEHCWYGKHVDEMMEVKRGKSVRLSGATLLLSSDFATGSYGHFLLDCMPRLHLLEKAGLALSSFDHIYCPTPPSSSAKRILQALNVDESKCVWSHDDANLEAEFLFAPTFPGTRRNYPAWTPSYLQSKIQCAAQRGRRLYISREGFRRSATNEAAVQRLMVSFGFEIYKPADHVDSIKDFGEASIIVAPHGGALSDIAFCAPGTKLLELIPSDHVFPYYYTLAEAGRLEYSYILCESLVTRRAGTFGPSLSDFKVDEQLLGDAVKSLIDAGGG
jgi:capsular polysaccharide biosynthesis protein